MVICMKLFNLDSPLMQGLGKMADIMWLNILTIVCCLPVITAGASLTAMNYMALKIARDEECYVTRGFFKSFKENFRQATIMWLIFLVVLILLAGDYFIMRSYNTGFSNVFQSVILAAAVLVLFTMTFAFPVLAKFENTVFKTIKNAMMISIMQFPKTILMIVMYAIPVVIFFFVMQLMPLTILFGVALPGWASAKLYNKFFKKLEEQIIAAQAPAEEEQGEDERIFKDELDPVLAEKEIGQ